MSKFLLKRRGFTDKLYFLNLKFAWKFTILCYVLNALSGFLQVVDLSIIVYGLPVVWSEVALHTGFVIWKAKMENCRKHKDANLISSEEELYGLDFK